MLLSRAGRREWWFSTFGNAVAGAIVGAVPGIGALLSLPWIIGTLAAFNVKGERREDRVGVWTRPTTSFL